jgi:hypothetical protein
LGTPTHRKELQGTGHSSSFNIRECNLRFELTSIELAHFLVIVGWIEVDGSEEVQDFQLFAMLDLFV